MNGRCYNIIIIIVEHGWAGSSRIPLCMSLALYRRYGNFRVLYPNFYQFSVHLIFVVSLGAQIVCVDLNNARKISRI